MPEEEKLEITDKFTKQLRNSGYNRRECREIVTSGVLGWKRRHRRRKELGLDFYRSARSTLHGRIRKKLLDPVQWYKPRTGEEQDNTAKEDTNTAKNDMSRPQGRKRKWERKEH